VAVAVLLREKENVLVAVLLRESDVAAEKKLEVVSEAEEGGRVTPGASVALRVCTADRAVCVAGAVTVTVTVAPDAQGVLEALSPVSVSVLGAFEPASVSVLVAFEPVSESALVLLNPTAEAEFVLFTAESESVQFELSASESTVAREEALDVAPEPMIPPETPVSLMRDSASACVSHEIDYTNHKPGELKEKDGVWVLPFRACSRVGRQSTGSLRRMG